MAPMILCYVFLGLLTHIIQSYNFGFNNSYTCHCLNNERCDPVIGGCYNGCLRGWGGPSCQRENIALDSTSVSQSGIFNNRRNLYGPQLVVDGYNSTDRRIHPCSDTETDRSLWQWWSVDLQQPYSIGYIKIFHRYDRLYLIKGFSVQIDDELCYKHTGDSNPPAVNLIECSRTLTGSTVEIKVYGKTYYITLCEVEVYVCSRGTYGSECNAFCHCLNYDKCDVITGQCPNGCQKGWHGDSCNTSCATINKYGLRCQKDCDTRQCSGISSCNHVTGECINGCKPGYQGIDCIQDCLSGAYGDSCSKQCNNRQCKGSQECHQITGTCTDGCKPGYKEHDCTVECDEGFYGNNCLSNCSARFCQSQDQCNNIDGACDCLDGYQGTDCTVIKETTGSDTTLITAVVSTCVVLIIIVVAVFIIWKKFRRGDDSPSRKISYKMDFITDNVAVAKSQVLGYEGPIYENSDTIRKATEATVSADQSTDDEDKASQLGFDADSNQYDNTIEAKTDFNLEELEQFVIKTSSGKGFSKMYKALLDEFTSSYDVSQIAEHRKKNRFKGYYPYDETRVILKKLPGDPHSDYINANYLNGYDGRKFIAAQGSTAATINDFVRMIWDIKCEKVVMVTREFEEGKMKCIRYWPEHGTETFGEIRLTLKWEKIRTNYTKRYITMERDGMTHEYCHFHYISWPDHGVPDVQDMLDFQYTVNKYIPNSTKPVLVHCSAGVGRTGTYIAIDYCLKRYNDIGKVDVLECVKTLREQRKGMVQTASQLQFIHEAVIEGIKRGDTAMNKDRFDSEYEEHGDSIKIGNSTLHEQFEYLKLVKNNGEKIENNKQIINNRIQLYRFSSYTSNNSILFEDLQKVSVNDIWNAVNEAQFSVVVFILDSTNKKVVCPDVGSEEMYGDVTVEAKSENTISDELNTLLVSVSNAQSQPHQVNVIIMNIDKSCEQIPRTLYKYILEILVQMDTFYNDIDPVTVFTSDLCYARVFCILMNILQRIRLDDEVEIFNVVRKIHSNIGPAIKSQEDYNTLHKVVFDFVRNQSTYANL